MHRAIRVVCTTAILALAGCSKGSGAPATGSSTPGPTTGAGGVAASGTGTDTPTAKSVLAGMFDASGNDYTGSIGVKECDELIAKMEACLAQHPNQKGAELQLRLLKERWAKAAKDPMYAGGLPSAGRTLLEKFSPTTCDAR